MTETIPDAAVLKNALLLACHAPSVYNSQPWRWMAQGGILDLFVDPRRIVARHPGDAGAFGPHFFRLVDKDFRDVFVRQPLLERRQIGRKVNAEMRYISRRRSRQIHPATVEKSRSFAVNTRMGWP